MLYTNNNFPIVSAGRGALHEMSLKIMNYVFWIKPNALQVSKVLDFNHFYGLSLWAIWPVPII